MWYVQEFEITTTPDSFGSITSISRTGYNASYDNKCLAQASLKERVDGGWWIKISKNAIIYYGRYGVFLIKVLNEKQWKKALATIPTN